MTTNHKQQIEERAAEQVVGMTASKAVAARVILKLFIRFDLKPQDIVDLALNELKELGY